jgi:hypothetical protein
MKRDGNRILVTLAAPLEIAAADQLTVIVT